MAISVIDAIVNMVRRELRDVEGANFKEMEIKAQLYNSVANINIRLGTTYTLQETDADGTVFDAGPTDNNHKYLIALLCAIDLMQGAYSEDSLSGEGGVKFRSGLSSYDATGKSVSFRDDIDRRLKRFEGLITALKVTGSLSAFDVDLYDTTESDMTNTL